MHKQARGFVSHKNSLFYMLEFLLACLLPDLPRLESIYFADFLVSKSVFLDRWSISHNIGFLLAIIKHNFKLNCWKRNVFFITIRITCL